jgi:RHH-type proline utilization regulon transcriptional repressor/proline dehydrogenase/delta 1-pyrroline-5-carboxylate dehydrogenase
MSMLDDQVPIPNRLQDRRNDSAVIPAAGFENAPDTDPALAGNRVWAYEIIKRSGSSRLGKSEIEKQFIETETALNEAIATAEQAGIEWGKRDPYERAALLHQIGVLLERNRGDLIEVAMSETGKGFDQADAEVSEAIDFAHYYAEQAKKLAEIDGAVAKPRRVTLVTPPWNFPIAIPAGSALAAIAAGSAVVFKPAGQAARCGAVVASLMNEVLPAGVLVPIQLEERALGSQLIAHPDVDQVILTGGFETAQLFRKFNPNLKLFAETSGKNAIIVTPNADLDLAVKDIAYSAFGHAGQKCSAASLVILVGSVAKSKRFMRQLEDAVKSIHVAHPQDPKAQMGPVIEAPQGKLLKGLITLERGESWILEPKKLDDSGKLWSPGIRVGVRPGSTSHKTEYFGPMLSVMTARNLEDAIALQNAVDYGLTAGLHSLDPIEINEWISKVEAGNLYVNRTITGAIVQRQPFGGWKRSSIGPTAKAGGPNYLATLTDFGSKPAILREVVKDKQLLQILALAAESELTDSEVESLTRGLQNDIAVRRDYFPQRSDPSGLASEINVLRYVPAGCELRISESASRYDSWRSIATMAALGNGTVSAFEIPQRLLKPLRKLGVSVKIESESQWLARINGLQSRVRWIGATSPVAADSALASCEIAIHDQKPTESGYLELLPYFKEQAVAITAHRFGNPVRFIKALEF